MNRTDISNTDNIIDSRDVIARIEELEAEREALADNLAECEDAYEFHDSDDTESTPEWTDLEEAREALAEWDASNEARELASLKTLADQRCEARVRVAVGEVLVRDSYFKDYAMELAEELARDEARDRSWPNTCIDWDQAARELRMDYTAVDFDGVTYWIR